MMVNAAVFVLVIGLIGAALVGGYHGGDAEKSGLRPVGYVDCTPVEVSKDRW